MPKAAYDESREKLTGDFDKDSIEVEEVEPWK